MGNISGKIKQIHSILAEEGADVGTVEEFNDWFMKPGDEGYKNRKSVWDAFKADGDDVGETYEEFADWLGLYPTNNPVGYQGKKAIEQGLKVGRAMAEAKDAAPVQTTPKETAPVQTSPQTTDTVWKPSVNDRIKAMHGAWQTTQNFKDTSKTVTDAFKRKVKSTTQEGRDELKSARMTAQMLGLPTEVPGLMRGTSEGANQQGAQDATPNNNADHVVNYGVKFVDGKAVTEWQLPDGRLTTDPMEADRAEAASRTVRLRNEFEKRMKQNGLDVSNKEHVQMQAYRDQNAPMYDVIDTIWSEAEADDVRAREKSKKESRSMTERLAVAFSDEIGPWSNPVTEERMQRELREYYERFDPMSLARKAYERMPKDYRDERIRAVSAYFRENPSEMPNVKPGAGEDKYTAAAREAVIGEMAGEFYDKVKDKSGPHSNVEHFMKSLSEHGYGTMGYMRKKIQAETSPMSYQAEQEATADYASKHKVTDIAATVTGFASDLVAGAGNAVGSKLAGYTLRGLGRAAIKREARRQGVKLATKGAAGVSTRLGAQMTLANLTSRMVGGGVGFGLYEGTHSAIEESALRNMKDENGNARGYSWANVAGAAGSGFLFGTVTSLAGGLFGNVMNKATKAVKPGVAKVALKDAQFVAAPLVEGAAMASVQMADPENNMDFWDLTLENAAVVAGFHAHGIIKKMPRTVSQTIDAMKGKGGTFESNIFERISNIMDGDSRIMVTRQDRDIMKNAGYGKLASLFVKSTGKTGTAEPVKWQDRELDNETFDGYEELRRFMSDKNVPESIRQKVYFIASKRVLPTSTILGYNAYENGDGTFTVDTTSADGTVVTRKLFKSKKEADAEALLSQHQVQLNSVDLNEKRVNDAIGQIATEEAMEGVALRKSLPKESVGEIMLKAMNGEELTKMEREIADEVSDDAEALFLEREEMSASGIRDKVNNEYDVDVDTALRKGVKSRTERENDAIEDYIARLDDAAKTISARQTPEQAAAAENYEKGASVAESYEKGDSSAQAEVDAINAKMEAARGRVNEAFGEEADYWMHHIDNDPWSVLEEPNLTDAQREAVLEYTNAKSESQGLSDAVNKIADDKIAKAQSDIDRRTHKASGMMIPAVMKANNKVVYIVKGDVVMHPDGSAVDVRNSSQRIFVCDAETGEYKMISPDRLLRVEQAIDPAERMSEIQKGIDAEKPAPTAPVETGRTEAPAEGNIADGEVIYPDINEARDTEAYERGYEEAAAMAAGADDAWVAEMVETYGRGPREQMPDEVKGRLAAYMDEMSRRTGIAPKQSAAAPTETAPEPAPETTPDVVPESTAPVPGAPQTALSRLPRNEKGDPLFEEAESPEHAWDALVEFSEGDAATAKEIADVMVEEKRKAYEKAQKLKAKGTTPTEILASKKANANELAKAQREYDMWSRMAEVEKTRMEAEARKQQEAEARKAADEAEAKKGAEMKTDESAPVETEAEPAGNEPIPEEGRVREEEPVVETPEVREEKAEPAPEAREASAEQTRSEAEIPQVIQMADEAPAQQEVVEPAPARADTATEESTPTERPRAMTDTIERLAKRIGCNVVYEDMGSDAPNGYFDAKTRTLTLNSNPRSVEAMNRTAAHEVHHAIRSTLGELGAEEFVKVCTNYARDMWSDAHVNSYYGEGARRAEYVNYLTSKYAERMARERNASIEDVWEEARAMAEKEVTDKYMEEELCSDVIGDILKDPARLGEFLSRIESPSMMRRVWESVKAVFNKMMDAMGIPKGDERLRNDVLREFERQFRKAENESNLKRVTGEDRYSVSSHIESIGGKPLEVATDEDSTMGFRRKDAEGRDIFAFRIGDKVYDRDHKIKGADIRANKDTAFVYMVENCLREGLCDERTARKAYETMAGIMNMYLETGGMDADVVARTFIMVGDKASKPLSNNSDNQYLKSFDITKLCKKNDQISKCILEWSKRQEYGCTPGQIIELARQVNAKGFLDPCPMCYVFSRYLSNGLFGTVARNVHKKYSDKLRDVRTMNDAERKEYLDFWKGEMRKSNAWNKANATAISNAKKDVQVVLWQIDGLTMRIAKLDSKEMKEGLTEAEQTERNQIIERIEFLSERYKAAVGVLCKAGEGMFIGNSILSGTARKGYELRDGGEKFYDPELVFNPAPSRDLSRRFPGWVAYRASRGAAAGKMASGASDYAPGDLVLGLGRSNKFDTQFLSGVGDEAASLEDYSNYYIKAQRAAEEGNLALRDKYLKEAGKALQKTAAYVKQQNLRGGQRQWSWSDFIPSLGTDTLMGQIEGMLVGMGEQTYSKQTEGLDMMGAVGAFANGSIIGKGLGYREMSADEVFEEGGRLYDRKTEKVWDYEHGCAMDYHEPVVRDAETGKLYRLEYDNELGVRWYGKIGKDGEYKKGLFDLVREHDTVQSITVGMDDRHIRMTIADDRHSFVIPWHASGMSNHVLAQLYNAIRKNIASYKAVDYTNVQSDHYLDAGKKVSETLRELYDSHNYNDEWKCGLGKIDSYGEDGKLSAGQKAYRALRERVLRGTLTEKDMKVVMADEFLKQLYESMDNGSFSMTEKDMKSIYPYEYWDKGSTYENADVNGRRYLEYCRRLGVLPKFSGMTSSGARVEYGHFVDDAGYWKLLIDRRMYDRKGKYQEMRSTEVDASDVEYADPEVYNQRHEVTRLADEKAVNSIVDAAQARERELIGENLHSDDFFDISGDEAVSRYKSAVASDNAAKKNLQTWQEEVEFFFKRFKNKRTGEEKKEAAWREIERLYEENAVEEADDADIRYSIRTKEPPKKTKKVYKLMRLGEDNQLYPLFIDAAAPTRLGVWYDADSPNLEMLRGLKSGQYLINPASGSVMTREEFINEHPEISAGEAYPSKEAINWATEQGSRWVMIEDTNAAQSRFGGENRKYWNIGINGSGSVSTFSMRPGWHAGSLPTMRQIGKGANKDLRDNRFVWVEGEVPADIDYQAEADRNPDKDMPDRIPEDGYYMKATNADKVKSQADRVGWYVAGAFKANRIISDAEARDIIDRHNAEHPDAPVEYDYPRESGEDFSPTEEMNTPYRGREAELDDMAGRVNDAANSMNTKVRVVRTEEELNALPSDRHRKSKGYYDPATGEVVVVLPNNRDVRDATTTVVREAVGRRGVEAMVGKENIPEFMEQVYSHIGKGLRDKIDGMSQGMYKAAVREAAAGGPIAEAQAVVDAERMRKDGTLRQRAMGDYLSDLAGRIGTEGFEKISAEEQTVWGRFKETVQRWLDRFLAKAGIPKSWKLSDNDLRYIVYKSWKNLGEQGPIAEAEDAVMRRQTGFGADDAVKFSLPGMDLETTITKMKTDAMRANADDLAARNDAIRAISGNLRSLTKAMSAQRDYDIATVKSVADLGRVMAESGLLDDVSNYEVKRMLSAVKNAVGKKDTSPYVQKMIDIMTGNQMRLGERTFENMLKISGNRVDSRGVVVQGRLDPAGQVMVKTVKDAMKLSEKDLDLAMGRVTNRMSSPNASTAEDAAAEYTGIYIAQEYAKNIQKSKAEEVTLRQSIKDALRDKNDGIMTADAYKQFAASVADAIRENHIDRIEAYNSLIEQMGGALDKSTDFARQWREAEKERVEKIHHYANSDLEGRDCKEHRKATTLERINNSLIPRLLFAPLGTFEQIFRSFGSKHVQGKGYLYNHFVQGLSDASEREYVGTSQERDILDEKVNEIFGDKKAKRGSKKFTWNDLFKLDRKLPKCEVEFRNGDGMDTVELRQSNLLYIYMANKMSDGRMKLRSMGITEEQVAKIEQVLDPRLIELADWLQSEYFTRTREKYNEVHKRMYGAPMPSVENYFPLKILKNALPETSDIATAHEGGEMESTITSAIIKRTRNNYALDITDANPFSIVLDHINNMEHWASYAEICRDINTLRSYNRFKNRVMGMNTAYGGGKQLWEFFNDVCQIAVGSYKPEASKVDKLAVNLAKGGTASCISGRLFTALKQFLSFPAFFSEASPLYLAKSIVRPDEAWKWTIENIPLAKKRWKSRSMGDIRLMESDLDWKMWRKSIAKKASQYGMTPNGFVDMLTVSMGAHATYKSRLKKYKRMGYDADKADIMAKRDATISYNLSQQSSEGSYLSRVQADRSWLSVLFTAFRNSSMSYSRQLYDALRNIGHRVKPGYAVMSKEFMTKQMIRDGIDPDKASANAKREYRTSFIRDLVRVGVFGYGLQFLWNLGPSLVYMVLGDNEDEKDRRLDEAKNRAMFGSIEGLFGGDVWSNGMYALTSGNLTHNTFTKEMPITGRIGDAIEMFMNGDHLEAANEAIGILTQTLVGVDPHTFTDIAAWTLANTGTDMTSTRELSLLFAQILNCPKSQLRDVYFDQIDATGEEASKMSPKEIADRYARYKVMSGTLLSGWAFGNARREALLQKYQERYRDAAKEKIDERTNKATEADMKKWLDEYDRTEKYLDNLNKTREDDEDAYYEKMDEFWNTPEYERYRIIKRYKHDIQEVTKNWMRAETPEEREMHLKAILQMKKDRLAELEDIQ